MYGAPGQYPASAGGPGSAGPTGGGPTGTERLEARNGEKMWAIVMGLLMAFMLLYSLIVQVLTWETTMLGGLPEYGFARAVLMIPTMGYDFLFLALAGLAVAVSGVKKGNMVAAIVAAVGVVVYVADYVAGAFDGAGTFLAGWALSSYGGFTWVQIVGWSILWAPLFLAVFVWSYGFGRHIGAAAAAAAATLVALIAYFGLHYLALEQLPYSAIFDYVETVVFRLGIFALFVGGVVVAKFLDKKIREKKAAPGQQVAGGYQQYGQQYGGQYGQQYGGQQYGGLQYGGPQQGGYQPGGSQQPPQSPSGWA